MDKGEAKRLENLAKWRKMAKKSGIVLKCKKCKIDITKEDCKCKVC